MSFRHAIVFPRCIITHSKFEQSFDVDTQFQEMWQERALTKYKEKMDSGGGGTEIESTEIIEKSCDGIIKWLNLICKIIVFGTWFLTTEMLLMLVAPIFRDTFTHHNSIFGWFFWFQYVRCSVFVLKWLYKCASLPFGIHLYFPFQQFVQQKLFLLLLLPLLQQFVVMEFYQRDCVTS